MWVRATSPRPVHFLALQEFVWVVLLHFRESAGQDFQSQILFVAESVRSLLNGADLIVEPLHEAQRHLVARFAVADDSIPVLIDHPREALIGPQPLPQQGFLPAKEKLAGGLRAAA